MGVLVTIGCLMFAFGPPLAIFIFVIARDPLRIILFVLGAFFWLLSLLFSSFLWFAVVPLRRYLVFGLVFSVAFQELFRFLYFFLLKKAQRGLEKVSANGLNIAGVHSLKDAKHTIAMVSGLGIGVMAGLFSVINVAADSIGPGVPGFAAAVDVQNATITFAGHGNYLFFLMSSIATLPVILLHMLWTVIFWSGCNQYKIKAHWWVFPLIVVISHYLVSCISLLNESRRYEVTLPFSYLSMLIMLVLAYEEAGGSCSRLISIFKHSSPIQSPSELTTERTDQQPTTSQREIAT